MLSEDPIRSELNYYTYCSNNPIRFVDPSGLMTEEEIKEVMTLYENNEMAPMAYSYAFELIYDWYLAIDNTAKDSIDVLFYAFRDTGYTTTNGVNQRVDDGIAFMPNKPTDSITQEQHYFRNQLNIEFEWDKFQKLQEALPEFLQWNELGFFQSAFHKFGQFNNRKYVSACEHFEAVYTKENYLVNEAFSSTNMGTYNYYGPANPGLHTKYDVDPWGVKGWGNVPKVKKPPFWSTWFKK